jgi:hypothetical protein
MWIETLMIPHLLLFWVYKEKHTRVFVVCDNYILTHCDAF